MSAIRLRPAQPQDAAFQQAVYASTRAAELALTGWDDPQKQAFVEMQFQAQTRHYTNFYPGAEFTIIEQDQAPIGRMVVWRTPEMLLLMDIALLPEFRRRGVGTALIQDLLAEAHQAGLPVRLHVEPFNPALGLYQRLGFTKISEGGFYYEMEWRAQEERIYDR